MKETFQNADKADRAPQLNEDAVCEICGCMGAFHLGGRTVCPDCYTGCGSCCPEFGKDDLWTFPNEEESANRE